MHGIEKNDSNGNISVSFGKKNDQLIIEVEDNGKGIKGSEKKDNHVSYALQIFKERIANLKKTDGPDISYHIGNRKPDDSQNPGTLVTVKLPLKLL
jgi:LytS/YehU family sensor histidine kinase